MATFAKSTFSAASYAAFRPTYPQQVFTTILNYHEGPKKLCLDLGCGHGPVSRTLAASFTSVIGTDPSAGMVKQAISSTAEDNVNFRQASAEDLSFIDDGSLDLVVAGQAAHWFDYSKVWPELKRTLRKGGTVAFFGYKDNVFVDYPKATSIMDHYIYGPGEDLMGMYWEQPGRNILRDQLRAIEPPEVDFGDVKRLEYEPGTNGPKSGTLGERLMHKKFNLGQMESYGRTFSAYHGWLEAHPKRTPHAEGGPGDIIDEMFKKILEAEPEWKKEGDNWREKVVETEWGSAILLARRK
ncbi:MAG: hypothetical protein M1818_000942 [Claussenomyces sp. TS43310]|nr:MAG: hypothetical protein M1818_000942 [Claussenomyces sp. TS43310]